MKLDDLKPIKVSLKFDADFTPAGKRTARIVKTIQGYRLRWYVSGRIYASMLPTIETGELTRAWMEAQR